MKFKLTSILLLIASAQTHALGGYSTWGTITDLYFGSAGDYVQITMDVSDSSTYCGQANKPYRLVYDSTNDLTKEFYKTRISALLAASMTGKQVRFYLTNGNCSNDSPKIQGLQVKP
jgi:hypothetical protein